LRRRCWSEADNYWSRINSVSASGLGEFRMALIKDDIGNWNLKSFDSDAGDLLRAYKDASVALINKAVTLAKDGANLADGFTGLLGVANQLALGTAPMSQAAAASTDAAGPLAALHRQTIERLTVSYNDASAKIASAEGDAEAVATIRRQAIGEWKAILGEHARVVMALSEATASPAPERAKEPAKGTAPTEANAKALLEKVRLQSD